MIRSNVAALGMLVDILEWDGNVDELKAFTPDQFQGIDEHGTAYTGTSRAAGYTRSIKPGDILVRPAGHDEISPLMFFREHWFTRELGLIE